MLDRLFMGAAADEKLFVEDVFSTYLYTGTGAAQTITNGIDLAGKGGLVWIKSRSNIVDNFLFDTTRGVNVEINSNKTDANATLADSVTAFNSNGFTIGNVSGIGSNTSTFASWTFRKAPKFFDVVTWTGNSTYNRQIPHSLGVTPGFIIVKATSSSSNWVVYHRSSDGMYLNTTGAASSTIYPIFFGDGTNAVAPTATNFTVGGAGAVNASGETYVAYVYAHDTTADGIIQCGSFTTDGSGAATVNLGWEPQWLMAKTTSAGPWVMADTMRGMTASNSIALLRANVADAESTTTIYAPNATGFSAINLNGSQTYIYIAIRRPMKTPTLGTQVYNAIAPATNSKAISNVGFNVDTAFAKTRLYPNSFIFLDRLRGGSKALKTASSDAEADVSPSNFDYSNQVFLSTLTWEINGGESVIHHFFRRAPGFFDEVCYTGNGSLAGINVNHNLGVKPELMIIKSRSSVGNWIVNQLYDGTNYRLLRLNQTTANISNVDGSNTNATTFRALQYNQDTGVAEDNLNVSGTTYVAYLFASAPGVSKVGSYTGNGSSQTINCAFTTGSRFVMIKRTDSTGDWYVWDSARGIVAGNDPYLRLNSTATEVTSNDTIDPDSSGFVVNQVAATNVNVNAATYIYLAIA